MLNVVMVEDTRFFNLSLNALRPMAKAIINDEDEDAFIRLTKIWLDAFNKKDGWQPYDTEDAKAIYRHFREPRYAPAPKTAALTVPAKVAAARIVGRRAPHMMTAPIPQSLTDTNRAMRLLTRNLVEWRAVDTHNYGPDFAALALWVYVARAIYDRVTKHMLSTPVGVRLRNDFLALLQQHWSPAPGQRTESRPNPTRPQWDSKHVEELMTATPPPITTRAEALDVQAKKEEMARWDQYAQDVKNLVNVVKKSTSARAFPDQKDATNPEVAAALDNLIMVSFFFSLYSLFGSRPSPAGDHRTN